MKNNFFYVSEIFDSIEGEGKRTGIMSIFVRLTGCNLRCSYCDTKYALVMGKEAIKMTEDELVNKVKEYPWKNITITGGEPLLHCLNDLLLKLPEYDINIETNGATPLLSHRPQNVFYTMDWKCPTSGENKKMLYENLKLLTKYDVLKFVVGNQEDLDEMKRVISLFKDVSPLFYVSPVFNKINPVDIVDYVKKNKLKNVYIQIQLHKVIWNPNQRGV